MNRSVNLSYSKDYYSSNKTNMNMIYFKSVSYIRMDNLKYLRVKEKTY